MHSQNLQWTRQFGTPGFETVAGVAADGAGNVYIAGAAGGDLYDVSPGPSDGFVAKYDSSGNQTWGRQFGSNGGDTVGDLAVDDLGNVYLTGITSGDLGGTNAGPFDAFVVKYDGSGNQVWLRQFGSAQNEEASSIWVDAAGNSYVAGMTGGVLGNSSAGSRDAFVRKFDAAGNMLWTSQFGSSGGDAARTVAADSFGNVYVAGIAGGSFSEVPSGADTGFLAKVSVDGALLWAKPFGTAPSDYMNDIHVDDLGNVFVVGSAFNSPLLFRLNQDGDVIWKTNYEYLAFGIPTGIAVDSRGVIYIGGYTNSAFAGPVIGDHDLFLVGYDYDGNLLSAQKLGTAATEFGGRVAADKFGNIFVGGYSKGALAGPNVGADDAVLVKYVVPEPSSCGAVILAFAISVSAVRGASRRQTQ